MCTYMNEYSSFVVVFLLVGLLERHSSVSCTHWKASTDMHERRIVLFVPLGEQEIPNNYSSHVSHVYLQ